MNSIAPNRKDIRNYAFTLPRECHTVSRSNLNKYNIKAILTITFFINRKIYTKFKSQEKAFQNIKCTFHMARNFIGTQGYKSNFTACIVGMGKKPFFSNLVQNKLKKTKKKQKNMFFSDFFSIFFLFLICFFL